jgi:hypothetical protein
MSDDKDPIQIIESRFMAGESVRDCFICRHHFRVRGSLLVKCNAPTPKENYFSREALACIHFCPDPEVVGKWPSLDDPGPFKKQNKILQKRTAQKSMPSTSVSITCPHCGRSLVDSVAKQGHSTGQVVWRCSGFPHCNYIRRP